MGEKWVPHGGSPRRVRAHSSELISEGGRAAWEAGAGGGGGRRGWGSSLVCLLWVLPSILRDRSICS